MRIIAVSHGCHARTRGAIDRKKKGIFLLVGCDIAGKQPVADKDVDFGAILVCLDGFLRHAVAIQKA